MDLRSNHRQLFWSRYDGFMVCFHCGITVIRNPEWNCPWAATIDHLVPRSRGGSNEMQNLALSCAKCNADRRDSVYTTPTHFQQQVSYYAHNKTCVICREAMARKELFIRNSSIEVNSAAWTWMPVHENCSPAGSEGCIHPHEEARLRAKAEALEKQLEEIHRLLALAQEARQRLAGAP